MVEFAPLKAEYQHCQRCPALCKSRTQVVFGSGNPQAEILLVGEAPGFQEDKQGIPFCGESGKVLQELLASIGLTREEVFITNTILCRPENNRNPAPEEVQNCRERLDMLIKIMQPMVIVTIGNFATQRILGKAGAGKIGLSTGITSLRGKVFTMKVFPILHPGASGQQEKERQPESQERNQQEIKVIPVIHPANYLYNGRNPQLLEQMKRDFQVIREQMKMDFEKVQEVNFGDGGKGGSPVNLGKGKMVGKDSGEAKEVVEEERKQKYLQEY